MKAVPFYLLFFIFLFVNNLAAQKSCAAFLYHQREQKSSPSPAGQVAVIKSFSLQQKMTAEATGASTGSLHKIVTIPVVFHILYHTPEEKVSDALVSKQLELLNKCFRHKNADSVNTPAVFKSLAADCEIEFVLATSTPRKVSTTGIVKKYTPVKSWTSDDKMKFSAEWGDDGWDANSYLNIWVCNLGDFAGYSSFIGGIEKKDGLVISFSEFGENKKTIVHEAGHWLNLKHLWGDANCGDDGIDDTPKQEGYTPGCPTGIRITCGNGPYGDMYSNYMDFTSDECTNLFTLGQKARMQALFVPGAARYSLLSSIGLTIPLIFQSAIEEEDPAWLQPKLYPNPASTQMTLDLSYDMRWLGKNIQVINLQGQTIMTLTITSKTQQIDISRLTSGMYFLTAQKGDGEFIKQKFIKL